MAKVFNSSEFSELSQMIELQINEMVSTWSGNDLKWIHIYQNKGDLIMNWYYILCYTIWYHLCNLTNAKNTHGGMLLSVKWQA